MISSRRCLLFAGTACPPSGPSLTRSRTGADFLSQRAPAHTQSIASKTTCDKVLCSRTTMDDLDDDQQPQDAEHRAVASAPPPNTATDNGSPTDGSADN
ncbi:hypothetical protein WJX75_007560 [Coccomyxa subellipsoidea]|uniref:Secreted protein n=1 Tax=Coccomyxa subellipsoidea TaxID=248742 RepID=A0ABR2YDF9_9CHLO